MTAPAPKGAPSEPVGVASFELLIRARGGDTDASNELLSRYLPRLRRWARGQLPAGARSVLDTGDIVQDVLIKAMRIIPVFEPRHEGAFQGFLRIILKNKIRDVARHVKRRPPGEPVDTAIPDEELSPLERAVGAENQARFEAALRRLPAEDRRAIFARLELRLTYEEVAGLLGKPTPNAARVAARRAMIRLAREMSRESCQP